jgi:hypothetical protein
MVRAVFALYIILAVPLVAAKSDLDSQLAAAKQAQKHLQHDMKHWQMEKNTLQDVVPDTKGVSVGSDAVVQVKADGSISSAPLVRGHPGASLKETSVMARKMVSPVPDPREASPCTDLNGTLPEGELAMMNATEQARMLDECNKAWETDPGCWERHTDEKERSEWDTIHSREEACLQAAMAAVMANGANHTGACDLHGLLHPLCEQEMRAKCADEADVELCYYPFLDQQDALRLSQMIANATSCFNATQDAISCFTQSGLSEIFGTDATDDCQEGNMDPGATATECFQKLIDAVNKRADVEKQHKKECKEGDCKDAQDYMDCMDNCTETKLKDWIAQQNLTTTTTTAR